MTYQKRCMLEVKNLASQNKTYTLPAKPPCGVAFDFKVHGQE